MYGVDRSYQRLMTKRFWQPGRTFFLSVFSLFFLLVCAVAVLYPQASGTDVYENGGTVVDASHSDQGYIMVKHRSDKALKVRISLKKATLNYDLNNVGEFEVFPLQLGNGNYKVEVFEQAKENKYSPVSSVTVAVKLADPNLPFLYPNQYVWYNMETEAVAKSAEICANVITDAEKVEAVYHYLVKNMAYDYDLASEIVKGKNKGHIPTVDVTLTTKTGVCFDFSALMACMLRSQGVATQLVIGYADKIYHAWNYVQVDGEWYQYDPTMEICNGVVKKYTPERVY